jgi:hypothetical protein
MNIQKLCFSFLLVMSIPLSGIFAQEPSTTSQVVAAEVSTNDQKKDAEADASKLNQENGSSKAEGESPDRTLAAIIGAVIAMLAGILVVYFKSRKTDFNEHSILALGLVLFFPTIILAFSVKNGINSEALAALLGAVAGYLLSRSSNKEKTTQEPARPEVPANQVVEAKA